MQINAQKNINYTLRIAIAMCFIGHGSFGIITKPIWCNYFAVFGIGQSMSYQLMPVVGCIDILIGLTMLFYPVRVIPAWLVIWGLVTALLRPLSGEPFAELIERAGNFGAPLALLVFAGTPRTFKGWFTRMDANAPVAMKTRNDLQLCLQVVGFLLLLGHGWLNIIQKKGLVSQYESLGFSDPYAVAQVVGIAEIIAAFVVLIKPYRPLILVFLFWKMGSELFYPHYDLLEWIERGGSYGALLALWFSTDRSSFRSYAGNRIQEEI
jgi:hypothetical protein